MSTNPTAEEEQQDAEADALFLAGVDYDARLARLRTILAAVAGAAGAAWIGAVALRAWGMTVVPDRVPAIAARYMPIPLALIFFLLAAFAHRLDGRPVIEPAPAPGGGSPPSSATRGRAVGAARC